jgi:integrase
MALRLNFTKAALLALRAPSNSARSRYYDAKVHGLTLSITAKDTRSFQLYRKISGRPEKIHLGRFEDLTVEQARILATRLNARIANGENPAETRRQARDEMTFGELFTQYLERHAKLNTKRWYESEAKFKQYCECDSRGGLKISHRRISSITRAEIALLHSRISRAHPVTANRVLALVSSVFGWAIKAGLWEKLNPASGISKNRERSRDRFLQASELPRFFRALAEEADETLRDYILMSLLTGARQANVLAMKWEQIDLANGLWHIPDTKNGTPHTVPLIREAISILERRMSANGLLDDFVFSGRGKCGHLREPRRNWHRIIDRAGLTNLRIHDLRRTLGSWQAATGASLTVIGKTLNHKHPSSTAIYARLSVGPVRAAVEVATKAIMDAGDACIDVASREIACSQDSSGPGINEHQTRSGAECY